MVRTALSRKLHQSPERTPGKRKVLFGNNQKRFPTGLMTDNKSISRSRSGAACGLTMAIMFVALWQGAMADEPTVQVDRSTVAMKESFNLIIDVSGSGVRDVPDFAVLEENFELIGPPRRATEVTTINGETQARTRFFVTLTPKRPGELQIPALKIGTASTQPLTIHVTEAAGVGAGDKAPDLFLEAQVSEAEPLVQSQVTYTMRLFHAIDIREGSLSEPELRDAVVVRLGDDVQYQVERFDRSYQVVERRFAVFPQISSPMTLPPPIFNGQLPEKRELSSLNDLFGQRGGSSGNPFGSFFHPTRLVRILGPAVQVDVKPVPAGADAKTWLPAAGLTLDESWTTKPLTFKVGEPTTRTLTVRALGVTAAHLPEIDVQSSDTIKVYADRPEMRTYSEGDFIVGERKVKLAMVPTQSGPLTLPAITLKWWDTGVGEPRVTEIPARKIAVLQSGLEEDTALLAGATPPAETGAGQSELVSGASRAGAWPLLGVALLAAWLITLVAWLRARGRGTITAEPDPESSASLTPNPQSLRRACLKNEAWQAKEALIAWAGSRWTNTQPQTLMAVAACVSSEDASNAVMELDRVLYDTGESTWSNGAHMWSCLRSEKGEKKSGKPAKKSRLPVLYPERSG